MEHKSLDTFLKEDLKDKVQDKRYFLSLFGSIRYLPTGEEIEEGFRYFDCESKDLIDAFVRRDFEAIGNLPFSLDEDGDRGASPLRIDVAYTNSGAFVAAQVVEFIEASPTCVTPVYYVEGPEAKELIPTFVKLAR